MSGGAGPSVVGQSGWASSPAARARSCRAPPLLARWRRTAPGAAPLGLHRHLPPPPPLSPPLLRRGLHGARPDGSAATSGPPALPARQRFRPGVAARRGRHGDSAAAAMAAPPESLLRYCPPVLVSHRGDRPSAAVSAQGPRRGAPRSAGAERAGGRACRGALPAPTALCCRVPAGSGPAHPRRLLRHAAAARAPEPHPAAAVSGAGPGPAVSGGRPVPPVTAGACLAGSGRRRRSSGCRRCPPRPAPAATSCSCRNSWTGSCSSGRRGRPGCAPCAGSSTRSASVSARHSSHPGDGLHLKNSLKSS